MVNVVRAVSTSVLQHKLFRALYCADPIDNNHWSFGYRATSCIPYRPFGFAFSLWLSKVVIKTLKSFSIVLRNKLKMVCFIAYTIDNNKTAKTLRDSITLTKVLNSENCYFPES